MRHWLLHLLHWQPCRNDCAYVNGVLHHWVYCVECGEIAFSFTMSKEPPAVAAVAGSVGRTVNLPRA